MFRRCVCYFCELPAVCTQNVYSINACFKKKNTHEKTVCGSTFIDVHFENCRLVFAFYQVGHH